MVSNQNGVCLDFFIPWYAFAFKLINLLKMSLIMCEIGSKALDNCANMSQILWRLGGIEYYCRDLVKLPNKLRALPGEIGMQDDKFAIVEI